MRSPGVDKESAQMDVAAPGFQWDGALKIVQRAEDTFNRSGVDAILNRYAEDVIPIRGSSGNPGKGRRRKDSFAPDSRGKVITD
jgi:hypothetical protein